MNIDVALNPAEIEKLAGRDLSQTDCVVFDVLRATSTMITALAHGSPAIYPVSSIEQARSLKAENERRILGGERHGLPPDGFDFGNSPLEYLQPEGREVILTTTNGTWALGHCQHAKRVWVASLLNLEATAEHLEKSESLLILCAGTFETASLEDIYAAGALVAMLADHCTSDAASVAKATYANWGNDAQACLRAARNGRALLARGWGDQIDWCAQISRFPLAALWKSGMIATVEA
jgi:2-phosphosulfolactate phosphatase